MLARPYLTLAEPYLQKELILSFLSRELFLIFKLSDQIISTLWSMIKSNLFTNPVCNTCVLFFRSDCFPKNYDEKEVADANTLKRAPIERTEAVAKRSDNRRFESVR